MIKPYKKSIYFLLFLSFFLYCHPEYALGYILPSEYILRTWINKHSQLKKIKITQLVKLTTSSIEFKEIIKYTTKKFRFQSWIFDKKENLLSFKEKQLSALSLIMQLFLDKHSGKLAHSLNENKIPILTEAEIFAFETEEEQLSKRKQSFSRTDRGQIAWVIGEKKALQEINTPQLWFEKNTFLPLILAYENKAGMVLKFEFSDYHFYDEFPFPHSITVTHSKELLISIQILEIIFNDDDHSSQTRSRLENLHEKINSKLQLYDELFR